MWLYAGDKGDLGEPVLGGVVVMVEEGPGVIVVGG
jgi:hypothetical protein